VNGLFLNFGHVVKTSGIGMQGTIANKKPTVLPQWVSTRLMSNCLATAVYQKLWTIPTVMAWMLGTVKVLP
jgi:hypothetical protein